MISSQFYRKVLIGEKTYGVAAHGFEHGFWVFVGKLDRECAKDVPLGDLFFD
jgi:hypothetical protein